MSAEKKYFLFNSQTQFRSEALDVQELISTLDSQNLSHWLFWTEGQSDWQQGDQCSALKALLPVKKAAPPPLPGFPPPIPEATIIAAKPIEDTVIAEVKKEVKPEVKAEVKVEEQVKLMKLPDAAPKFDEKSVVATVITTEAPVLTPEEVKQNEDDRRKFRRVPLRLKAIISNKSKAFITFTENVSMGGMLVTHTIPEEILKMECEVFLCNLESQLGVSFKCLPIADESKKNRFEFTIEDQTHAKTLKQWLESQTKATGKKPA